SSDLPAARVGVTNQQCDRRAGGQPLVDTRQDLHLVSLAPCRGVAGATGGTALQVVAEVFGGQRQARRATVDHAADRRPVAFAKGRDRGQCSAGGGGRGGCPT